MDTNKHTSLTIPCANAVDWKAAWLRTLVLANQLMLYETTMQFDLEKLNAGAQVRWFCPKTNLCYVNFVYNGRVKHHGIPKKVASGCYVSKFIHW